MNVKIRFSLLISLVIISSVMIFPFAVTVLLLPIIFVAGNNPIIPNVAAFSFLLMMGVGIQTWVMAFAIKNLYRMIKQVKINELG